MKIIMLGIVIFLFTSCKQNDYEDESFYTDDIKVYATNYMTLEPEANKMVQGGACYEDYFFQGYAYNQSLTVYNLKTKEKIQTISIPAPPSSSKIHCNTINFGNKKYSPDDFFPILYVSSGYHISGMSRIYAYRIQLEPNTSGKESFSMELIQTINLEDFGSWTEGILDNENDYLWIKYEKEGKNGRYGYAKYMQPSLDEKIATINYDNYLDDFTLALLPKGSNQCHLFYHDHIYLVSGVPANDEPVALISINTITHEEDLIINLRKCGLKGEPETLIRYDDHFMIGYYRSIQKLDIEDI